MMLQWFDGEGKPVQRDEYYYSQSSHQYLFSQTVYHIYSAVLGKLLTEVKSNGTKKRTFVYGMNGVVAQQKVEATYQEVRWEHTDPSNASYVQTGYNGLQYFDAAAELDPLGSNVGLQAPQTEQMIGGGGWGYGSWGDPFGGYSCRMDGFEMPCSFVMQSVSSGSAYFAPLGAENAFTPNGQGKFVPNPIYGNPSWSDYQWQCCDDNGKYYPVPTAHMGSSGTMTNGFLSTSFGQSQTQTVLEKRTSPGGGNQKPRKVDLKRLKNAMDACIKEVFRAFEVAVQNITLATSKSNGSITYANKVGSFTIETGMNFNFAQLNTAFREKSAGGITPGTTSGTATYYGQTISLDGRRANYIANDSEGRYVDDKTKLDELIGITVTNQIHENGHSLFMNLFPLSDADGDGKTADGLPQQEYGTAFTNCIFKEYK